MNKGENSPIFCVHSVFYDLVRFENGKIAEHWDVIQTVPTDGLANDNTMFNFD